MLDKSLRPLHALAWFLRKPAHISNLRWLSAAAGKEHINLDLLKSYNEDIRAGGVVPVFKKALLFPSRTALHDDFGTYTYREVYDAAFTLSRSIAKQLLGEKECTICYMCPNNATHVIVQWAIWMTGNIAVPLTPLHPEEMLKYFVTDSDSKLMICTEDFEKRMLPIADELRKPLIVYNKTEHSSAKTNPRDEDDLSNFFYAKTEAMLIYTSGTTSKPKGVVWTHGMLAAGTAALHAAWRCGARDVVLHALPLHHIHGQLNSLHASLAAGARVRMLPSFASHAVWAELLGRAVGGAAGGAGGEPVQADAAKKSARVTVFHGVPAMYARLAADWDALFADARTRRHVRDTLARMRLMCAGSAPLPDTLYHKWLEISGHRLLERYGMSEVGMALSNPYRPEEARAVGCVGVPLPGVAACLAAAPAPAPDQDDAPPAADQLRPLVTVECAAPDTTISLEALGLAGAGGEEVNAWAAPRVTQHEAGAAEAAQGELLLRGSAVFARYWRRLPQLGAADFTADGWFRTGDTAAWADGRFRILGRTSVDIIKSGGYKVSALQVEAALLAAAGVADAAVLGVAHAALGEAVAAVLAPRAGARLEPGAVRAAAAARLAPYQLPRALLVVPALPRNVMGKLDKKEIRRLYERELLQQLKR